MCPSAETWVSKIHFSLVPKLRFMRHCIISALPFWTFPLSFWRSDSLYPYHIKLSHCTNLPIPKLSSPWAGISLYTGRLWYHMCSCQTTVGLTILSLYKFVFFVLPAYSTVGWQLHIWYHSLPACKEFPGQSCLNGFLELLIQSILQTLMTRQWNDKNENWNKRLFFSIKFFTF